MIIVQPNSSNGTTTANGLIVSESMAAKIQTKPDAETPDTGLPTAAAPMQSKP